MADTSTKKSGKGWRVQIRKILRWPHAKKKDKEETAVPTKLFPIDETGQSHQVSSPFTITTKKEDNASNTDSSFIAEKSKLTQPNSLVIPADCFGPSENIVTQPKNDLVFTETRLSLSSPPGIFENDSRNLVVSGQKAIENPPSPLEIANVSDTKEKVIEGAKVVQEESSPSKKTEKLQWVTLETETKVMPESENAEVVELPYLSIESEENEEVHADLNEKLLKSQGELSVESELPDNAGFVNEVLITTNENDNAQHTTPEEEGITEEIHSEKEEAHLNAKSEAEGSPEHQVGKEVQKRDESIETFETAFGSLGEQVSLEQSSGYNPEPSTTLLIENAESLKRMEEKERMSETEPTIIGELQEPQRECSPSYLEKLDFLEENILSQTDSGEFLKPQEVQDECNLPSESNSADPTSEEIEQSHSSSENHEIQQSTISNENKPTVTPEMLGESIYESTEHQEKYGPSESDITRDIQGFVDCQKEDILDSHVITFESPSQEHQLKTEPIEELESREDSSPDQNPAQPATFESDQVVQFNQPDNMVNKNVSMDKMFSPSQTVAGDEIFENYGPFKSDFTQDTQGKPAKADCQKEDILDAHVITFESPSQEHQLKTEPMEQLELQEDSSPDQNPAQPATFESDLVQYNQRDNMVNKNASMDNLFSPSQTVAGAEIFKKYGPSKSDFTQDIQGKPAKADCQKEDILDSHVITFESPSQEHQLKTEQMNQLEPQEDSSPNQNPAQPATFESDQAVQYNQPDNMVNKNVSMDNLFSPSQTVACSEIFENQVKLDNVPTVPLEELIETMDVQEVDNLAVQNSQIFEKDSNKLDTSPKSDVTNETFITSSENQESVSADQGFESDDNNQEIGNLGINYQQATWTDLQQPSQYYFQNNLDHQYNQLAYDEQHYMQQVYDPQMLLSSPSNLTYYDSSWVSHGRYLSQDWQENALENNENTLPESVQEINNQPMMLSIENHEYLNMGSIEQNPNNLQSYSELHQSFSCAETFETLIDPIMTFPHEHDRPVSREAAWHQVPALGNSDKFWPEVESLPSEPDLRTVQENSVTQANYTYQAPNPLIITHEIVYESQMYPTGEENQWVDHSENTFGQMEEGNDPTSPKPETSQKGFSKNEASPSERALDESTSVFESKYSWHTAAVSFNALDEVEAANQPLPEQSNLPIHPSPEQELPKVLAEGEIVVEAEKFKQDGKPVTRDASQHQGDVDDQQSTEQNSIFASPPNLSTENRSEKFFFGPDPLHYSK